jgi:hypothetical protein
MHPRTGVCPRSLTAPKGALNHAWESCGQVNATGGDQAQPPAGLDSGRSARGCSPATRQDPEPELARLEVAERLLSTILVLLVIAALLVYTLRRRR